MEGSNNCHMAATPRRVNIHHRAVSEHSDAEQVKPTATNRKHSPSQLHTGMLPLICLPVCEAHQSDRDHVSDKPVVPVQRCTQAMLSLNSVDQPLQSETSKSKKTPLWFPSSTVSSATLAVPAARRQNMLPAQLDFIDEAYLSGTSDTGR